MRIVGGVALNDYAKRKPRKKECLLAFRALVEAASWRRMKDLETQFARVVSIAPPDRAVFDFPDEDLYIGMRVNCALGLARIFTVGPSEHRKSK